MNKKTLFQIIYLTMVFLFKFNIILLLVFTLLIISNVTSQEKNIGVPLSKQISQFELGIRYLKLGNTYREAKEFHLAKKYLDKGHNLIKRFGNNYWEAAANEFFGYLYRDIELWSKSLEHLQIARNIYSKIIKLDGGSNDAISQVIENIKKYSDKVNEQKPEGYDNDVLNHKTNNDIENKIKTLEVENKKLADENLLLIQSNKNLIEQITQLEKNIEAYKSKLNSKDKLDFPSTQVIIKEMTNPISKTDGNSNNQSSDVESSINKSNNSMSVNDKVNDNSGMSNKEKELKLIKTGYSYKQGNVIVDMYGNKIYIDK